MSRLSLRGLPQTRLCRRPGRAWVWWLATLAAVVLLVGLSASPASAHVVPTSTVQLAVTQHTVTADAAIPVTDLAAASGLDLGDGSAAEVADQSEAIASYLRQHVQPSTDDGVAWTVRVDRISVAEAGDPTTTGMYQQVTARLTLTPPEGADVRSFNLGYDAVVHQVATHVVLVILQSDWAGGTVASARQLGVVQRDTVTNAVRPLHLDLGAGSTARGIAAMVSLGMQHIAEGTDHQLFLLTLLLPAPLLTVGRRWGPAASARTAVRRIAGITLAFTLGHSVTLALGALGMPVPQGPVEALIAVSILVAAVHAIVPLFPGREMVVAAAFGLVHGLAFSQTLRDLDLAGAQLVLSLLGFNLGIEAMQVVVVALVLPPLILLARAGRYRTLRVGAALLTAIAAIGWLLDRVGVANPVASLADHLVVVALWLVVGLWLAAITLTVRRRRSTGGAQPGEPMAVGTGSS